MNGNAICTLGRGFLIMHKILGILSDIAGLNNT